MNRFRVLWVVFCGAGATFAAEPCVPSATVRFSAGLAIDADGAPKAYGPNGLGLDALANAGKPGNWWGLATRDGVPIVQGPQDPAPGYYVSTTALEDRRQPEGSPLRYVDSSTVPYVVLPPSQLKKQGVRLGDFAAVVNERTGAVAYAIVADLGPEGKLGEGSIALAEALGVPSNPRRGGTSEQLRYLIFPHSGNGKPRRERRLSAKAHACTSPQPPAPLTDEGTRASRRRVECAPVLATRHWRAVRAGRREWWGSDRALRGDWR